jgi:intein/homing endonuclease
MPWTVNHGAKYIQQAHVPKWIFDDHNYIKAVLRGLIQTDGSIYVDREYTMVNFTTIIETLAKDAASLIQRLGFQPSVGQTMQKSGKVKYTIRLTRKSEEFIKLINLHKS